MAVPAGRIHRRAASRALGSGVASLLLVTLTALLLRALPVSRTPDVAAFYADVGERARAAEAAASKSGPLAAVEGRDGWRFLAAELRALSRGRFWGKGTWLGRGGVKSSDPLTAIVDFRDQLRRLGIELLFVPVPLKAFVYPDLLAEGLGGAGDRPPRLDVYHQDFLRTLERHGVHTLDLLPDLLEHRFGPGDPAFLREDTHWSGRGCELAARRIAEEVRRFPWARDLPSVEFTSEEREHVLSRPDLARASSAPGEPQRIRLRHVGRGSPPSPMGIVRESPIVVIGDSYAAVYHESMPPADTALGAGLVDQLALELKHPVDHIAVAGGGATSVRRRLRRLGFLRSKKVVVWCLGARFLADGEPWAEVPLAAAVAPRAPGLLPPVRAVLYRLYNDATDEHVYTLDAEERSVLSDLGWHPRRNLGRALIAATADSIRLYRLLDPPTERHRWTTDEEELRALKAQGWIEEGAYPILAHPGKGRIGLHRFAKRVPPREVLTTDAREVAALGARSDWQHRGIIGFLLREGSRSRRPAGTSPRPPE